MLTEQEVMDIQRFAVRTRIADGWIARGDEVMLYPPMGGG